MTPSPTSPPGHAIVRAASWIVPDDVRRDWMREWLAELEWSRRDGTGLLGLRFRALGAWPHACWLRWDRWRWEMLWHDVRYAARTLVRKPGFAAIAILSLAIGIGANTAMFGVVHAVLLRPLPYPNPGELVAIWTTTAERPGRGYESSPPDFVDWRRDTDAFNGMAAYVASASALTGDGAAEQVPSALVTGDFFGVLGVAAQHGRALAPEDDPIGTPDVAVLSQGLWRRRFGGDPAIIGRTIAIDGRQVRVVGVMPAGFRHPLNAEMWLPQRFSEQELRTQRGAHYLEVIARLAPGVSREAAHVALSASAARLSELYPKTNAGGLVQVEPLREAMVGDVRRALVLMLGAVGFVLLIVCVNVANLCLARALGRQREMAVRMALGAGRSRLVRTLMAESALLALAGGTAGIVVATWATSLIAGLRDRTGIALLDESRLDGTVVLVAAGLTLLTAVLFGTLPAWQASGRFDVSRAVRDDSGTTTLSRGRRRVGAGLIVAETALAVVLLVGAGLLMRSFVALVQVDLGIRTAGVQTFMLSLPESRYPTPPSRAVFVESLLERINGQPDVTAAAATFGLPLTDFGYVISMSTLDGRTLDDQEQDERSVQVRVATPDFFRAMGIPLHRGRPFDVTDTLGAPPVAIVNQLAADQLWPGTDPLGHAFTLGTRLGQGGPPVGGTVVGVVGNVREAGPSRPVRPTVYVSHGQFPTGFLAVTVLAANGDGSTLVEPLRRVLTDLDPSLPMFRVRTMDQLAADAVARPRLFLTLLGLFAAAAMLLAAIGIYGVLSQTVNQRTREIGLRLALGADRGRVVRMVVGQAIALAGIGLVIGFILSAGLGRLLGGLLFGVAATDAATYAGVAAGLAVVALVASAVPALRAARVDPIAALRSE